jgi:hypothetical protein
VGNISIKYIKNTPEEEFVGLSLSETYNKGKGEFVYTVLNLAA